MKITGAGAGFALLSFLVLLGASPSRVTAALPAPTLTAPAPGASLQSLGVSLAWTVPQGATQCQLQVVPANNDGPSLNIIRNVVSSYNVPPPPTWYLMLPGMTYSWRVRVTDKASFASENDSSWGPWSETRTFQTPVPASVGMQAVSLPDGSVVDSINPVTLQWSLPDPAIFYFEIQVSGDHQFDTNPTTATSFVWWNLVHGGISSPANSWHTPPLQPGTTYYWRVRPRVQGDGTPVAWGPTWTFATRSNEKIAFVSDRRGRSDGSGLTYDIYTMNPDGTRMTRLTARRYSAEKLAWSPEGTKIAFESWSDGGNYEIFVINTDGTGERQLTNNLGTDSYPAWSPDGTRIAFKSERDGNAGIYLMNVDGSGVKQLTQDASDYSPAWSPDGAKIAFNSYRNGKGNIYTMNSDGTNVTRLTDVSGSDWSDSPTWSPDGSKLAFSSFQNGNVDIYVMNVDSNNQRRVTTGPLNDYSPSWSPDGTKIAYQYGESYPTGIFDIYLIDADGTGEVNLTKAKSVEFNGYPAWSPK